MFMFPITIYEFQREFTRLWSLVNTVYQEIFIRGGGGKVTKREQILRILSETESMKFY